MAAPRKKAEPKEEVKEVVKTIKEVPTEKKYRYQFDTWEDYWAYEGPKG